RTPRSISRSSTSARSRTSCSRSPSLSLSLSPALRPPGPHLCVATECGPAARCRSGRPPADSCRCQGMVSNLSCVPPLTDPQSLAPQLKQKEEEFTAIKQRSLELAAQLEQQRSVRFCHCSSDRDF